MDARVAYRGDRDGRVEASFRRRVVADSVVQRLGLVVLHPADAAGRPFEALDGAGEVTLRGRFPELVSPERVPTAVRSLRWEPATGMHATLSFDGDPWETEDQRAWTDASFKSYSPPIDWPHPVELAAGAVVRHLVRLDVAARVEADAAGARRRSSRRSARASGWSLQPRTPAPLPPIGLGWGGPIGRRRRDAASRAATRASARRPRPCASRLAGGTETGPPGMRRPSAPPCSWSSWPSRTRRRARVAEALDGVEAPIVGALAFGTTDDPGLVTTDGSAVGALRDRLRAVVPDLLVGGGSRVGYAELATADLPIGRPRAVAFAVTPQMHATDPATIVENLSTLPVIMRSAAALSDRPSTSCAPSGRGSTGTRRHPAASRGDPDRRPAGGRARAGLADRHAGGRACRPRRPVSTVLEAAGPAGVLMPTTADGANSLARSSGRSGRWATHRSPRSRRRRACTAVAIRSGDRLRVIVANLRDRPTTIRLDLPAEQRQLSRTGSSSAPSGIA